MLVPISYYCSRELRTPGWDLSAQDDPNLCLMLSAAAKTTVAPSTRKPAVQTARDPGQVSALVLGAFASGIRLRNERGHWQGELGCALQS
jgi:hypothetical protein